MKNRSTCEELPAFELQEQRRPRRPMKWFDNSAKILRALSVLMMCFAFATWVVARDQIRRPEGTQVSYLEFAELAIGKSIHQNIRLELHADADYLLFTDLRDGGKKWAYAPKNIPIAEQISLLGYNIEVNTDRFLLSSLLYEAPVFFATLALFFLGLSLVSLLQQKQEKSELKSCES